MHEVVMAKTFLASARRLGTADQARVLEFMARFTANPLSGGIHLEKINVPDERMRSARITQGLRAIVHANGAQLTLLYAAQHDDAYAWAERRKLEKHGHTGVLQIVETAERVEQELRERPHTLNEPRLIPLERYDDSYLLSLGVPETWLPTVRLLRDEEDLYHILEQIPEEAAERLIDLASGKRVSPPEPVDATAPLSASEDNLRRFRVLGEQELEEWLEKPFEVWVHFLHPSQRELVTRNFRGPAKVTGAAGTGKTVVALHRARELARAGKRVLLTSFVKALCQNLGRNMRALCTADELERIEISTVHQTALRLVCAVGERVTPVEDERVARSLEVARGRMAPDLDSEFIASEWRLVVAAQGITTWDAYRDAERRGRGRPLGVRERQRVWAVFQEVEAELAATRSATWAGICRRALELLESGAARSPHDAVLVDEVQDLKPIELRLLAKLAERESEPAELLLVGDAGQRIYAGGFSLRSLGIDVRGRSRVLRINYRTTEQIRLAADRVLGDAGDDLDGDAEARTPARSLLQGPAPTLRGFSSEAAENAFIAEATAELIASGITPTEIAIFARIHRRLDSLAEALRGAKVGVQTPAERGSEDDGRVHLGTMHGAKGLEFRIVFVAGCSASLMPLQSLLRKASDDADRAALEARERSLLYVSMTRARDEAYLTWSGKRSPFLE